jgi:hypothetical protein
MKGTFWNSDKFGDIAKHKFVKDTIREHQLVFLLFLRRADRIFHKLS